MPDPLLGELSWVDVVTRSDAMPLVILPVGAVEQHGPHLPLVVDSIAVEALAVEASRNTGVVVAPTVLYSSSQGHGSRYPGTLALSPRTAQSVLEELGRWLASAGFRKVFLLNGHLGNTGVLWNAVDELVAALSPEYDMGRKSPSGSIGRGVTRATAEDGRRLFDHAAQVLSVVLAQMLAEQPPPAAPEDVFAWRLDAARRFAGDEQVGA